MLFELIGKILWGVEIKLLADLFNRFRAVGDQFLCAFNAKLYEIIHNGNARRFFKRTAKIGNAIIECVRNCFEGKALIDIFRKEKLHVLNKSFIIFRL